MVRITGSHLLVAAAAALLPAAAVAQETTPAPSPAPAAAPAVPAAPTPEEAAEIRRRLAALQQRARQDPGIVAASDSFGNDVLAAMHRLDPGAATRTARATAIQTEAAAARAASDNERLNALAQEGRELQVYFAALRERAMALPEVEEKRQAFVARLFARMTELDAEAPSLVARLDALRAAPPAAGDSAQ